MGMTTFHVFYRVTYRVRHHERTRKTISEADPLGLDPPSPMPSSGGAHLKSGYMVMHGDPLKQTKRHIFFLNIQLKH